MHKSQTAAMSLIITDYDNQYEKSTDIDTADNNSCYSKCNTDGVVYTQCDSAWRHVTIIFRRLFY
jgi:hypothetical protein